MLGQCLCFIGIVIIPRADFQLLCGFCYQLWKQEHHDQSSPNHRAQHERTKECLNGLKDILLSNQPPPGYNDHYYGHAWFSFHLQCQSLE